VAEIRVVLTCDVIDGARILHREHLGGNAQDALEASDIIGIVRRPV